MWRVLVLVCDGSIMPTAAEVIVTKRSSLGMVWTKLEQRPFHAKNKRTSQDQHILHGKRRVWYLRFFVDTDEIKAGGLVTPVLPKTLSPGIIGKFSCSLADYLSRRVTACSFPEREFRQEAAMLSQRPRRSLAVAVAKYRGSLSQGLYNSLKGPFFRGSDSVRHRSSSTLLRSQCWRGLHCQTGHGNCLIRAFTLA